MIKRPRTRAALVALTIVATVIGLPAVANAHHYEDPGNKGAQIDVTPDGSEPAVTGTSPGLLPVQTVAVEGKSYPANTRIELRQCTPAACTTVGAVIADAAGAFRADVVVSVYPVAGDTAGRTVACASQGPNQCTIVAVQLFGSYTNEPSSVEHNICFAPITAVGGACSTTRISTTTTTTTAPPAWEPAASMSVARHGLATAVGLDGRVYALGGTDAAFHTTQAGNGAALNTAEMLDPCGTRTWTAIAPMPTARTQFAAATSPDGRIYAIGGRDSFNGTPLATVDAYDPATNTWSSTARLAVPRSDLAATTGPDGVIYAIGGSVGGGSVGNAVGIAVPTVETYDVAADQWATGTPLPPAASNTLPRAGLGAATGPDGRVYAISGDPNSSGTNLSDTPTPGPVESYSPGPDGTPGIWRKEATPAYADGRLPFGLAATTGPDGLIYAIGGQAPQVGDSARTVYSFDTAADAWTLSQEALMTRRWQHGVAAGKDGRIYAIGGVDYDVDAVDPVPPLASTESLQVGPNICPRLTQPADFDGDFDTDVSVFRPGSGTWFAKDGDTVAYGAEGDIPVPADYDGDAKTDVAVFRPSVGLWAIHRSSDGSDVFVTYGIGTDIPVPADYDGDGSTDIAIYRPEFATWWVRHSSTGLDVPTTFGIGTDTPVPADYDGDARADIAVFRGGTWFTLPSSGASFLATAYGAPGEIPVPADYDADRVIDRAVFRTSDATWSLHRSSDNTDETFTFGVSGDVPVPGDYNGDRISDPAVFRPSSGGWFIETGETHSWGLSTNIPLPLPPAVRLAYFGG